MSNRFTAVLVLVALALIAWLLVRYPPLAAVPRGQIAVRTNLLTGKVSQFRDGILWVIPGMQAVRDFELHDQVYRPADSAKADAAAPFQSIEGLSVGVDLAVRYAIDPTLIASIARTLPDDIDADVIEPAVKSVAYPLLAGYTVREIFTSKRAEIQRTIEQQLRARLASDGIVLRGVQMGEVDLPPDYRAGLEKLLAEELETEKMKYTLELKDKQVKARELEGEADKVRRRKSAEARRIEASAEADSRRKLADAEVYRLGKINQATSEQMARESTLISQNPLLIQKTMADKLSDKVQVIIAAPPAQGGFIGSNLLGAK